MICQDEKKKVIEKKERKKDNVINLERD